MVIKDDFQYNTSFVIIYHSVSFLKNMSIVSCLMDIRCRHHHNPGAWWTRAVITPLVRDNYIHFLQFLILKYSNAILWSLVLCHNYQNPCRMLQYDSETLPSFQQEAIEIGITQHAPG